MTLSVPTIVIAAFALLVVVYVASAIKIVRPYQQAIVEQLGKYRSTVGPGLHVIAPLVQRIRTIDMREQVVDVPPQEVITEDNVVVSVDAVVYYEPTDPTRLLYNVYDFILAVTKLAQTNLRNVIGDMDLDQALTSRDQINGALRQILDDATDKWGVRVARVEIQRIDPPPDVMNAMHEQMKAERTRRAVVTQADGERQAAIARAEGAKQAAILAAEGVRQRQILEAEGEAEAVQALADADRYRARVVAEGESEAIRSVYAAIHEGDPTPDLLAVRSLDTLAAVADGRATKIFLPADVAGVLGTIGAIGETLGDRVGVAPADRDGDGADGRRSTRTAAPARPADELAGATDASRRLVEDSIERLGEPAPDQGAPTRSGSQVRSSTRWSRGSSS